MPKAKNRPPKEPTTQQSSKSSKRARDDSDFLDDLLNERSEEFDSESENIDPNKQIRSRKKLKFEDRNFKPGNPRGTSQEYNSALRTNNDPTLTTSALITGELSKPEQKAFEKEVSHPTHSSIEKVTKMSERGSPLKGFTKSGVKVYLVTSIEDKASGTTLYLFSSKKPPKVGRVDSLPVDHSFFRSRAHIGTYKIEPNKFGSVDITIDFMKQTYRQNQRRAERVSQKKVVAKPGFSNDVSANKYKDAAGVDPNVEYEFCHAIGKAISAELATNYNNIFVGSKALNDLMTLIESLVHYLLKKFGEFRLTVVPDLVENTNLARYVQIKIETEYLNFDLKMDAQVAERPPAAFKKYIQGMIKSKIQALEEQLAQSSSEDEVQHSPIKDKNLYWDKAEALKSKEEAKPEEEPDKKPGLQPRRLTDSY